MIWHLIRAALIIDGLNLINPYCSILLQVIDTKSKLYLVMEYCGRDVCDLYDYIQKKLGGSGLDESEAKHIFRQVTFTCISCLITFPTDHHFQ